MNDPVTLLHVGHYKTGTTWMQTHLFDDAEIGFRMPFRHQELEKMIALPHPFDYDAEPIRAQVLAAAREAHAQNRVPVFSSERFSGALYSGSYDSQMLADRMAELFPDARVLIAIREQKSMLRSIYSQFIRGGGSHTLDDFLRSDPPILMSRFQLDYLKYHRLIRCYQRLFGQDRVLVLPYEMFPRQPDQFVERIASFCGLTVPPQANIRQNYTKRELPRLSSVQMTFRRRLHFWFGMRQVTNLTGIFPLQGKYIRYPRRVLDMIAEHLPASWIQASERRLQQRIAVIVGDRYQASNAETARLLSVNLRDYGYDLPAVEPPVSSTDEPS